MSLVVVGAGLAACGGSLTTVHEGLRTAGVSSAAYTLTTTDEAVALERAGSGLRLTHVVAGEDGWEIERCSASGTSGFSSIVGYFCGAEGPFVHRWNAFLYGVAADPVAHLDLRDMDVTGGDVRDGLWLAAIGETDLPIGSVRWAGLSSDGRVIASGAGVPGA